MKTKSVYVLYLQFTNKHWESAFQVMKSKVLSKLDYEKLVWITIDNSVSQDVEMVKGSGFYEISGDNTSREFSGFDKGVKLLKRLEPGINDVVIFANDTFHRSYGDTYLDHVSKTKLKEMSAGGVLGYVDSFPASVIAFNRTFSSWIRTSFFMLNYSLLDTVLPFTIPIERETVFGAGPSEFFKTNDILSENYKQYIRTWLFDPPTEASEFKESWHSKQPLNDANFISMQEKAWCILCEQQMSARLSENKIPIVKINS